jgi:hypothetical protein
LTKNIIKKKGIFIKKYFFFNKNNISLIASIYLMGVLPANMYSLLKVFLLFIIILKYASARSSKKTGCIKFSPFPIIGIICFFTSRDS